MPSTHKSPNVLCSGHFVPWHGRSATVTRAHSGGTPEEEVAREDPGEWANENGDLVRALRRDKFSKPVGNGSSGAIFSRVILNGGTCRSHGEYYGSEEFEPYTADGEFWPAGAGASIDDIFDRWDTYDAAPIDPTTCEFAIKAGFEVPWGYDWNASTSDNYAGPAGDFEGPYSRHRAKLDYSYHVNYVPARQRLQDEIVNSWVQSGVVAERPWIVFTAGAMGAGKSHMLAVMEQRGCPTLATMVKVDPDTIKYQLPEMGEYIRRNPGPKPSGDVILAGVATHKESGYLQEIIVREMMERRMHLVVDGSLANAEWYADYLRRIRRRHPEYRIGILHVVCDPEAIWARVQRRCEETGRCISRSTVQLSLKVTPQAVSRLGPLADFVAVVNSSTEEMVELRAAGSRLFNRRGAVIRQSSEEAFARLERLLSDSSQS